MPLALITQPHVILAALVYDSQISILRGMLIP
jgi:hypothetical protein